jgi:molybdopterin/thiamine biosynthesis adenylyltransferase
MLNKAQYFRYHRQMISPLLGVAGQEKLARAKVLQVGCGGLGSILAQCLVRAGVGELTIVDSDTVDISNLHRQFLFDEHDVWQQRKKVDVAAERLRRANSDATINAVAERLSADNLDRILSGHHLVLDGTDNMATRFLINQWCIDKDVPWIYGGIVETQGMVMTIVPHQGPCLMCLYPFPMDDSTTSPVHSPPPVINTTPTLVAALQVTEAFKLILDGAHAITDLRIIDLWSGEYRRQPISRNANCACCGAPGDPVTLPVDRLGRLLKNSA